MITKIIRTALLLTLGQLGMATTASADPVENVIGLEVTSPGALVASLDRLFASGAMDGYELSLWANSFDGTNPATHTIVARFDDYAAHDRLTQQRLGHPGWAQFGLAVRDISSVTSTGLLIERFSEGRVEAGHRAGAAFIMAVSDPAAYATAFARFMDATDNPGSARLVESRFGGQGMTHAVVISAPSLAEMNEYFDELFAGDAYEDFIDDVGDIRTIRTVNNYTLIKRWDN